jgi:hypothetical protein
MESRIDRWLGALAAGATCAEIGAGEDPPITHQAVSLALKNAGFSPRELLNEKARQRAAHYKDELKKGRSVIDLAREFGVKPENVYRLMIKHGLWEQKPSAEVVRGHRERIEKMWAKIQGGKTPAEVGAEESPPIGAETVRRALRRWGYWVSLK